MTICDIFQVLLSANFPGITEIMVALPFNNTSLSNQRLTRLLMQGRRAG